ncbi:GON domain-containing protein [Umezawaea endophytica]|uniref:GON domain-containing protein n=1 Tax=Umezawaea endophytica TaxID=1654476 RepID=A0A9X2VVK1_9PSEU|nr:GON domain-containing protein [Umezawaea endophytica]MCS7483500.1 GON domain-containing protein [Umezawaea endophytica]
MIRRIVVAVAAAALVVITPSTASARQALTIPPADCAGIRAALPIAGDGNYLLNTGTHLVPVYCHDMAGTPREYVTLGAANFSQYTAGGAAPGTSVRTTFTRVRLDPATLVVDINDLTFATSTGSLTQGGTVVVSMPYAVAMSCNSSASGVARVDLTGTAFVLSDTFQVGGFNASGSATTSPDNRAADVTGGGYCGWTTSAPYIYNPTNPSGPDFHLDLACGPYNLIDVVLNRACVTL